MGESNATSVASPFELFNEFRDKHGAFIDHFAAVVDKGFDINKQISSLHERLMLISLGTLGLSITALTAFIPKLPGVNFPRHTFVYFVVPAWILLFVTVTCCRSVMVQVVNANKSLADQWRQQAETYNIKEIWLSLIKLSRAIPGVIQFEGKEQNAGAVFAELAAKIGECVPKDMELQTTTILEASNKLSNQIRIQSRVGMLSMQIGMLLLGIAAIKLFLSF